MLNKSLPVIAITGGDPAGVGGEILLKSFSQLTGRAVPVLFADQARLRWEAEQLQLAFPACDIVTQLTARPARPTLVDLHLPGAAGITYGTVSTTGGMLALAAVERAAGAIKSTFADGVVTLPLSKAGLRAAGGKHPGHTELLRELSGAEEVVMAFAGAGLKVALLTIHTPLARVPGLVTRDNLRRKLAIVIAALKRDFGVAAPRVGVLGLNPHAGEDGMLGREEQEVITPVISEFRDRGIDIAGPLVPDVAFRKRDAFDLLFALYHDQGLIPFKMLAFETGVNVTLGLPFVRTSVDHGTAYDIAGRGKADTASFLAAVTLAVSMVQNRAPA